MAESFKKLIAADKWRCDGKVQRFSASEWIVGLWVQDNPVTGNRSIHSG